jgi:hypothetical protein
MNGKLGWLLMSVLAAGCATVGAIQGQNPSGGSTDSANDASALVPDVFPPTQQQSMLPSIVLPVTGGAPVIGIPLGGDMFLPVTGGDPIIGIPTGP